MKQNVVISTPYNTINVLRTIEAILGLDPLNLYDGTAATMSDLFDTTLSPSAFTCSGSCMYHWKSSEDMPGGSCSISK